MKKWYLSKTLWFNGLTCLAIILKAKAGFEINPEEISAVLVTGNVMLRAFTKDQITQ